jgi:hypothetical protein
MLVGVIPETDIWRVANLMLKHRGDKAEAESTRGVDTLPEGGDDGSVAIWLRVVDPVWKSAPNRDPSP